MWFFFRARRCGRVCFLLPSLRKGNYGVPTGPDEQQSALLASTPLATPLLGAAVCTPALRDFELRDFEFSTTMARQRARMERTLTPVEVVQAKTNCFLPGGPRTDPGDPGTDPGDPGAVPGVPGTGPGVPGTCPEDPGTRGGAGGWQPSLPWRRLNLEPPTLQSPSFFA